jgi:hypothetical protein
MACSDEGMFNCRVIKSSVKIGNGKELSATKIGDKRMTVVQKDGSTADVLLKDCKYVLQLYTKLFSITKALQKGWIIYNHGNSGMKINKDDFMIVFDHVIQTELGQILGVEMIPRGESAHVTFKKGTSVDINKIHAILGHINEEKVKRTAKYYGIDLIGTMEKCEHCVLAKARQKNV